MPGILGFRKYFRQSREKSTIKSQQKAIKSLYIKNKNFIRRDNV